MIVCKAFVFDIFRQLYDFLPHKYIDHCHLYQLRGNYTSKHKYQIPFNPGDLIFDFGELFSSHNKFQMFYASLEFVFIYSNAPVNDSLKASHRLTDCCYF